jgi:hypothetical protein
VTRSTCSYGNEVVAEKMCTTVSVADPDRLDTARSRLVTPSRQSVASACVAGGKAEAPDRVPDRFQRGRSLAARSQLNWGSRQRSRRVLGPDQVITLQAAATLTHALNQLGQAEQARALGEDTLQRSRRVLGPDHPTTLDAATALTLALVQLGEVEPARALGEDTLQRCHRVLGPHHPITLYLTEAANIT